MFGSLEKQKNENEKKKKGEGGDKTDISLSLYYFKQLRGMLKREWNGINIPHSILSKFPFIPNELPKKSIDRILFFPFLEMTIVL